MAWTLERYERDPGESPEVRILYAFFPGQKIVLLHGFLKKTRTIPPRELETARARLQEVQES